MSTASLLELAWGLGALLVAARAVVGVFLAKKLASGAHAAHAGARLHPGIQGPLVVGLLRPVILLPLASASWSAERLRAVLLHESAHVRRHDGLALLVAQCACALYWFQPLAWLAARRLRRECELAADESVLSAGMRAMAAAYGVFANDGVYAASSERVIKESTARTVRSMLEGVVTGERATGKAAGVAGVRVGGKTGTSDEPDCAACPQGTGVFASFVGIVPIDQPRYVIYVGVGQPDKEGSGGTIAAPVFARIAARALAD